MRRSPSRRLALVLACAALPSTLAAQDELPASGGAAFLLVPVGARATALGQAAVADAGSGEAAFWNPAGLATLGESEFGAHYASTFISNNAALTFHVVNRHLGTVGIAAYLVDYGSQDAVPGGGGPPTGRSASKNVELIASYATDVGRTVALGVSYKLIQFRQECQGDCGTLRSLTGTTHAVDIGAQIVLGGGDALRLGVAVHHAGFKLQLENRDQADPLPTHVAVGVAYRLPLPESLTREALGARLLVDLQDEWGEYQDPDARVGLEFAYADLVQLRAGYAFVESAARGPSIGIGLRLERVMIDFARVFYDSGTFDEPVYLSLRVQL